MSIFSAIKSLVVALERNLNPNYIMESKQPLGSIQSGHVQFHRRITLYNNKKEKKSGRDSHCLPLSQHKRCVFECNFECSRSCTIV